MKKVIVFIITLFLTISLSSCKKKEKAVVNLCCVDYHNMHDNYTGIDIIDEGCRIAEVDYWIINCNVGDKVNASVRVYEGYYIKTCYFNTVYTLDNATIVEVNNNSVEVVAAGLINYLIFDIVPIEA